MVRAWCEQAGDSALLSGELGGKLLDTISAELSVVYEPTFREQPDWGKAAAEQPAEFKGELSKFVASIEEAVRGMGVGVVLAKPRKDVDLDLVLRQVRFCAVWGLVARGSWCVACGVWRVACGRVVFRDTSDV